MNVILQDTVISEKISDQTGSKTPKNFVSATANYLRSLNDKIKLTRQKIEIPTDLIYFSIKEWWGRSEQTTCECATIDSIFNFDDGSFIIKCTRMSNNFSRLNTDEVLKGQFLK